MHIKESLFLEIGIISKKVNIFKILDNEKFVLHEFTLHTPFTYSNKYKIMELFDRFYLYIFCNGKSLRFVDLNTGKTAIDYQFGERVDFAEMNWNMSEIALTKQLEEYSWDMLSDDEDEEEEAPELVFTVKRIKFHDITLKHFARLASLKSFDENYLNQCLPISQRKYLGLSH